MKTTDEIMLLAQEFADAAVAHKQGVTLYANDQGDLEWESIEALAAKFVDATKALRQAVTVLRGFEIDVWEAEVDDATVVQIDTNGYSGRVRINVNDAPVYDANPETNEGPIPNTYEEN